MANGHDRSDRIIFIVLAVAGAFGLLGLCFVVAPRTGAALFGIPVESGPAVALCQSPSGKFRFLINTFRRGAGA